MIVYVLWLARGITGYRLRHVLALSVLLAAGLFATTLAFWWLGERADALAGLAGVLIVAVAYLWTATLGLAVAAFSVARLTVARVRRRAAPLGFSAAR